MCRKMNGLNNRQLLSHTKITVFNPGGRGGGVHVPIHLTNCRPGGKTRRHDTFDSNVKNAFAQRIVCDSCVLRVCEVYSQPSHRMSRTRTNGSNCRHSKTKQKKRGKERKKKVFWKFVRWHRRCFWFLTKKCSSDADQLHQWNKYSLSLNNTFVLIIL